MHVKQTVLLVDDDPHLLSALRRALRFEPYEVLLAETAGAALWLLASSRVDVLVTDQRMPGMSGAEFLAKVRAEYPHVISIMLTGHADLATAISAINAGEVYRFFTKPCDAGSLAAAIRQALQLKTLIRQTRQLLDTVRRQAVELGAGGTIGDDADGEGAASAIVYEADATVDLDALIREIEAELEAAEARPTAGQPPRGVPR
jgi:two-component system, probable response regulator PhcQ